MEATIPVAVILVPPPVTFKTTPSVCPVADNTNIDPVVKEFAVTAITLVPANTPVFVTEKAVALVEEDVMFPCAEIATPFKVVAAGKSQEFEPELKLIF